MNLLDALFVADNDLDFDCLGRFRHNERSLCCCFR